MKQKLLDELDEARREVADRVARRHRPEDDERLDEIERAIVARVRWERLS
jgi:Skp family chaperone for outer membrane proteins